MTTMLSGIDISYWQDAEPLAGCSFAFARATYGTTTDSRYAQHMTAFHKTGIVTGAYAFGINADGAAQARAFLAVAHDADLLALDWEAEKGKPPMTEAQARAFIEAVHAAGRTIGLYHSLSGFPDVGQDWNWVAAWGSVEPHIPWAFWQYQGNGLDRDHFNGNELALQALAKKGVTVSLTPAEQAALADVTTMWGHISVLSHAAKTNRKSLAIDLRTLARDATHAADLIAPSDAEGSVQPAEPPAAITPPVVVAPATKLSVMSAAPEHVSAVPTLNSDYLRFGIAMQTCEPNGMQAAIRWPTDNGTKLPASPTPRPGFVVVHGGPMPIPNYDNAGSLIGPWLVQYVGGVALSIDWHTSGSWAQAMADVAQAVAWLRINAVQYGVNRVYLLAHSEGGIIGLACANLADGYIAIDAVNTVSPGTFDMTPVIPPVTVPALVIEGSLDLTGQTQAASAAVAADLASRNVAGRYFEIDGADHTSTLITKSVLDAISAFVADA